MDGGKTQAKNSSAAAPTASHTATSFLAKPSGAWEKPARRRRHSCASLHVNQRRFSLPAGSAPWWGAERAPVRHSLPSGGNQDGTGGPRPSRGGKAKHMYSRNRLSGTWGPLPANNAGNHGKHITLFGGQASVNYLL